MITIPQNDGRIWNLGDRVVSVGGWDVAIYEVVRRKSNGAPIWRKREVIAKLGGKIRSCHYRHLPQFAAEYAAANGLTLYLPALNNRLAPTQAWLIENALNKL